MVKITHSPKETIEFAKSIGQQLHGSEVIAYIGGLGAGKTTFTRGLAIGLGLEDEVTSPTFALVNEYHGKINLYHFDMYRITTLENLETTGFYDYMNNDSVIAIEWSENIKDYLPSDTIYISFERIDDNTRKIVIDGGELLDSFRD